jgi:hypothetical protein
LKVVIIIAKSQDVHALAVAAELSAALNARAVILDAGEYPAAWRLTIPVEGASDPGWMIRGRDWEIDSRQVAGVWLRRPRRHRIAPEVKGRRERGFCLDEARAVFQGWLHGLGNRVVNPLAAEFAANQKPFQLMKAKEAGLRIPRTVITSDPGDASRFIEDLRGPAVFKALTGTSWQFTETRRLLDEHSQYLDKLRYAPVIFQELIEARCDVRANVIDNRVFAVSIRPDHPGAILDWRMDAASRIAPYVLPPQTERALVRLVRALGLRFGAIDLRLNPDGDYVFLEVNPAGQFLFCEIHAGQPISRQLAESLLSGPPQGR